MWPETAFTGPLRLIEVITMQGLKDVTSIISEKERPSKLVYGSVKGLVKTVFVSNGTLKIDPIMKV